MHDAPADLARLHLNESATAPAACVRAIEAELGSTNLYPDARYEALTAAIARRWAVGQGNVAVGNGADELLLICALTLGDLSRPGVVTEGTFTGHRFALEVARRGVRSVPLVGGRIDASAFARALPGAGLAVLCTPHNPSGVALGQDELDEITLAAAAADVPLVVDEAYMEFAPAGTASAASIAPDGRVVVLRTFSKAYGLAGVRVGYAIGSQQTVQALANAQRVLPFRVNRLGQVAALAALEDRDHLKRVREDVASRRTWFTAALRERGFSVPDSAANFVAVRVTDPTATRERLFRDFGIAVRDTTDMGYMGHVRISLGTRDVLERILVALDHLNGDVA